MKKVAAGAGVIVLLLIAYQAIFSGPEIINKDPLGTSIICFGDSLTAGTGAEPGQGYPSKLAKRLARDVINAGVPGDTTASALSRLSEDVLDHDPRIVLITLGGNDLMSDVPAADAMDRLGTIISRIQDRGALVIVGGLRPPIHGRAYIEGYDQLCEDNGCVLIDNVLDDIMGKSGLMSDRIHPNAKGYEVMAGTFEKAIRPYL